MSVPIYVDPLFVAESRKPAAWAVGQRNGHQWCHMWPATGVADGLQALHAMAQKIGMKREWFQNKEGFPHYDLTPNKRRMALQSGAEEMSLMEWKRKLDLKDPYETHKRTEKPKVIQTELLF
jgi:hypothetical protein